MTVREIEAEGSVLLIPDIEVENYWTSLEKPIDTIIELYHKHATCEQFHSELKSDLNIERLPPGKSSTNTLVLDLAAFIYNILRMIGQQFLNSSGNPPEPKECVMRPHENHFETDNFYCRSAGHYSTTNLLPDQHLYEGATDS